MKDSESIEELTIHLYRLECGVYCVVGKPLREITKRTEKKNDSDRGLGSWLFSSEPSRIRLASCRLQ